MSSRGLRCETEGMLHEWHTRCSTLKEIFTRLTLVAFACGFGRVNGENRMITWWRHQMETFSALLAICAGNSPVSGEFPAQRPVTRSFDVFFDVRLIKRLGKHSRGWWFETLSHPLWRHRNESSANQLIFAWIKSQLFRRRHFQTHFLEWNSSIYYYNFTEVCSLGSNWRQPSIGLDNGLAPNRRQEIIWKTADPIPRRIYAAVVGDELRNQGNG